MIPRLLALLEHPTLAASAADAIAQALKGFDPQQDPDMIALVGERLRRVADVGDVRRAVGVVALGRIPYLAPEDVTRAEHILARILGATRADHYYDGLTFHRIVPNFIIQGGSPGANEYAGQKEYMRDEIARTNERGTVGVSIRGRNTGDAQFYINLVDNPRLDYDYTIFARVFAEDMSVVDEIQEGDTIDRIAIAGCR